ncbi:hypothetical protein DPMN_004999 [Dreissena polymorpha]|uniref:Uncharacterized protein n=1 Tax=Dreissena polymorpha TaxID=45954 RepID=A0A9D4MPI6_DREPO|nr:hypothetical protein DPMN_004999 [Dreissena polymorpha]
MKRYRQRNREINADTNISSESLTNQTPFQNRMQKCRALTILKDTITPFSPQRRAAILQSLIDSSSPVSKTTRRCLEFKQVVQPSENKTRNKVACALLADVSSSISSAIDKTSATEKRVEMTDRWQSSSGQGQPEGSQHTICTRKLKPTNDQTAVLQPLNVIQAQRR